MVVDTKKVMSTEPPDSWSVRKMRAVLERQGQIEPLQVREIGTHYVTFEQDPWGAALVRAAKDLGWATMLVVVMPRYEQ